MDPLEPEPPMPIVPDGLDEGVPHTADIVAFEPRRGARGRALETPRIPPHNREAEESVLGALLISKRAQDEVLPLLSGDDFYQPAHETIYGAVVELTRRGEAVDAVTVAEELRRQGRLEDVGNKHYLALLVSAVPSAASAVYYAKIVAELGTLRRVIDEASQIAAEAFDVPDDVARFVRRAQERLAAGVGSIEETALLPAQSIRELLAEVDAMPAPRYLLRPVWAEDAYGVLAAEDKAGKTWLMLDAAVAIASGTSWLGVYPCDAPGPCLLFTGEGGKRKIARRLRAIAAERGLRLEDLQIVIVARAPHLTDTAYLVEVRRLLERHRPRFVAIDPLYLAARGAKGSDLYEMGAHLEAVQHLTQDAGAALMIVHHWNKTGQGKGAQRMSGVGPGAWGRVLISVDVERRAAEGPASVVTLGLSFTGDETAEGAIRIRRRVWADDPDDLASPMHYVLERLADRAADDGEDAADSGEEAGLRTNQRRVLRALRGSEIELSVKAIGDALARDADGHPLKRRTLSEILAELAELGLARSVGRRGRGGVEFWEAIEEPPADVESRDESDAEVGGEVPAELFGPEEV